MDVMVARSHLRLRILRQTSTLARRRSAWLLLPLLVVVSDGCMSNAGDPIHVEREVLVPRLFGNPSALARLGDGGFVIAGSANTGWAVRTDAGGRELWRYEEPYDRNQEKMDQSTFHGAIALANGHILLVGQSLHTNEYGTGLIVVLDDRGRLIERRVLSPMDQHANFASLDDVTPWGEGFALLGGGTDYTHGYLWLVKLDKNGTKEWDRIDGALAGISGLASGDGTLLQVGSPKGVGITVVRLNQKGERQASVDADFLEAKLVRSYTSRDEPRLVARDRHLKSFLVSLGHDLQVKDVSPMSGPDIKEGAAFGLSDGSVALFGYQLIDAGGAYRSTLGRWGHKERVVEVRLPNRGDGSYSFRGAVRISPTRFVALRDQVGNNDAETGAVLSWVSFN
ncbi:MAG TPA: hypothetical protein VME42_02270 [Steroidobacteraceae bacterium]|nr:hypothetical protein [Steroidobacteraceae bacterium]